MRSLAPCALFLAACSATAPPPAPARAPEKRAEAEAQAPVRASLPAWQAPIAPADDGEVIRWHTSIAAARAAAAADGNPVLLYFTFDT